ncbi:MAG: signal peptidase II [Clostridia bacterium]|nr:signal peptidase II [Clostridia bacterium]
MGKKYGWIAVLALVLDRITKLAAVQMTSPVTIIPGVVGLRYVRNTGMAFSLLAGHPWLLAAGSVIILLAGGYAFTRKHHGPLACTAAMLILGGAAGNLIDRIFLGYVVDMVEVLFVRFAIFNLADACLTVGCLLMALSLLTQSEEWSDTPHE